jgi:hypothetical protein
MATLDNPILNTPYRILSCHCVLDNVPTLSGVRLMHSIGMPIWGAA